MHITENMYTFVVLEWLSDTERNDFSLTQAQGNHTIELFTLSKLWGCKQIFTFV